MNIKKSRACRLLPLALLPLVFACASTTSGTKIQNAKVRKAPNDRFRQSAPGVVEVGEQATAAFDKTTLRNGLVVFCQERSDAPLTNISLIFRHLEGQEEKRAAADVYLTLAEYKITQALSWAQVSSKRERQYLRIDLVTTNKDAQRTLEALSTLARFKFNDAELETAKARVRYQLAARNKGLRARSARNPSVEALVYGPEHSFARPVLSIEDVSLLTRRDMKRFRLKGLNAKDTALVVVSPLKKSKIKTLSARALSKIRGQRGSAKPLPPLEASDARIVLDPSSEYDNALVRIGHVYKDDALNALVDDLLKERLRRALVNKGFERYYLESEQGDWSYFSLTLEVPSNKSAEALYVLADVYEQLRQKNLSENEITLTKRHILQAKHMAWVDDPALLAIETFVYERSPSYFSKVQKRQREVEPEALREHAQKYLSPKLWRVHLQGNLSMKPALEAIEVAPVELEDTP